MTTKEKNRQIADIMEHFHFANTLKMMEAVNWKHRDKPVTMRGLKALARRLFNHLSRYGQCSSGGLCARWEMVDGHECLSLEFVGEEYEAESEE